MPRNVEIKARIADLKRLRNLAQQLSGGEGTLIVQQDTFFNAPNGRLKLRELQGATSQLIFYARPDKEGPKLSNFQITETNNPGQLKETLGQALGIKGVVKKQRWLYLVGQTRVHVDQVENLGDFMELEVVLNDSQSVEEGQVIAEELRKKLEVNTSDLLTGAYMDMILKNQCTNGH